MKNKLLGLAIGIWYPAMWLMIVAINSSGDEVPARPPHAVYGPDLFWAIALLTVPSGIFAVLGFLIWLDED